MKEQVIKAFEESIDVKRRFVQEHVDRIVQVANVIAAAFHEGHKVLLFGNGGSSTDASHIAAEFVGRYHRERRPLPAIALATDMAAITCIANDYDYAEIFARQVKAHGQKGDVVIAISTSGNSPNVLKGLEAARELGLTRQGREARRHGGLSLRRPFDGDRPDSRKSHYARSRAVRAHRGKPICKSVRRLGLQSCRSMFPSSRPIR
jgi:D-sedoheptulose 7-phosphate isomerase